MKNFKKARTQSSKNQPKSKFMKEISLSLIKGGLRGNQSRIERKLRRIYKG